MCSEIVEVERLFPLGICEQIVDVSIFFEDDVIFPISVVECSTIVHV